MKVLVADDDTVIRTILKQILEKWGHEVVVATDGETAWNTIRQQGNLQVLILDWMMPGLDGPDICRLVRRADRERYVFILLITSRSGRDDFLEGMSAGADDFVTKPIDVEELHVRLRSAERVIRLEDDLKEHINLLSNANERMKQDLVAAARVQRAFFPAQAPRIPGYQFAWTYAPSEYVAGDLLNVFRLDESRWAFYVLDVSGHGVPAALLSVTLSRMIIPTPEAGKDKSSARPPLSVPPELADPPQVVKMLNRKFPLDARSCMFCTLIYAVLNTETGDVDYIRAGHEPPLVIGSDGANSQFYDKPCAAAVGPFAMDESGLENGRLTLQPGDRLFLYSDGLTDSSRDEHYTDLFGHDRLAQVLRDSTGDSLEQALKNALAASAKWSGSDVFSDDVTMLALERRKTGS